MSYPVCYNKCILKLIYGSLEEFILSHNSFAIANATYRIIIFARKTFNKGWFIFIQWNKLLSSSTLQKFSTSASGFLIPSKDLTELEYPWVSALVFCTCSLFDYIQGKNNYKQRIEMIAPVITEVSPSDGPFCKSSFVFSFFVPKLNQANPPPAKGLRVQRWNNVYVAARQFGGHVNDSNVGWKPLRCELVLLAQNGLVPLTKATELVMLLFTPWHNTMTLLNMRMWMRYGSCLKWKVNGMQCEICERTIFSTWLLKFIQENWADHGLRY